MQTCVVPSAHLLFQHFKDDSEPCHRAKLVTIWRCNNNIRVLTLSAQFLHLNAIENLCYKVALESVKRHLTIKNELIESLIVA